MNSIDSPLLGLSQRLPPQNMQAEQALLGALLANNKAYERVAEFLAPEHFADPIHGRIFRAIARRIDQGQLADAVVEHLPKKYDQMLGKRFVGGVDLSGGQWQKVALARAYMREALAVLIAYRINYARLFGDVDALPPKQQRSIRDRERAISESLRDILIELRPELKRHETLLMPITLLSMGSLVWSHTWFDPKGPVSLDRLVDLATALLVNGLDGALAVAEAQD